MASRNHRGDPHPRSLLKSGSRITRRFPIETPFVPYSRALLESVALRSLSINARRCFDRLMLEHVQNAQLENGRLIVTYEDFCRYGATRESIADALAELEATGLIRIVERGGFHFGERRPHLYRLTMFPTWDLEGPSNDWRKVEEETVSAFRTDRRERRASRCAYRKRQRILPAE